MDIETLEVSPVEIARRYSFISVTKRAWVYPSGYGHVRFDAVLKVEDAAFLGAVHYFGLTAAVPADQKLLPVQELCKRKLFAAPQTPFMNYGLVGAHRERFKMAPTELVTQGDPGQRMRAVLFEFSPHCRVGDEIAYAWEWGFLGLYDMTTGARESSAYRCLAPVAELRLEVSFFRPEVGIGKEFAQGPLLRVESPSGTEERGPPERTVEYDIDRTTYRWVADHVRVGYRFAIEWQSL